MAVGAKPNRSATKGKLRIGKGANPEQTATKAVDINNMNEQQLTAEIAEIEKAEASINKKQRMLLKDPWLDSMRQAFPLGSGGLSTAQIAKMVGDRNEASLKKASQYVKNQDTLDTLSKRKAAMQSAVETVKGTGQTVNQIVAQRKAALASQSNRTWTRGKAGTSTTYTSGDYTIRMTGGMAFVYNNGRRVYTGGSLKDAKAAVAQLDKMRK